MELRVLRSRARCVECGSPLPPRTEAWVDDDDRTVRCVYCHRAVQPAAPLVVEEIRGEPLPTPTVPAPAPDPPAPSRPDRPRIRRPAADAAAGPETGGPAPTAAPGRSAPAPAEPPEATVAAAAPDERAGAGAPPVGPASDDRTEPGPAEAPPGGVPGEVRSDLTSPAGAPEEKEAVVAAADEPIARPDTAPAAAPPLPTRSAAGAPPPAPATPVPDGAPPAATPAATPAETPAPAAAEAAGIGDERGDVGAPAATAAPAAPDVVENPPAPPSDAPSSSDEADGSPVPGPLVAAHPFADGGAPLAWKDDLFQGPPAGAQARAPVVEKPSVSLKFTAVVADLARGRPEPVDEVGSVLKSAENRGLIWMPSRKTVGGFHIDNLVVTPNGIWVVATEPAPHGRVEKRDVGDWFTPEPRLYVGDDDHTHAIRRIESIDDSLRRSVRGTSLADVSRFKVLCFDDAPPGWLDRPFPFDDVWVTWSRHLVEPMLATVNHQQDEVAEMAEALDKLLVTGP